MAFVMKRGDSEDRNGRFGEVSRRFFGMGERDQLTKMIVQATIMQKRMVAPAEGTTRRNVSLGSDQLGLIATRGDESAEEVRISRKPT
jgi:hypothetical protein